MPPMLPDMNALLINDRHAELRRQADEARKARLARRSRPARTVRRFRLPWRGRAVPIAVSTPAHGVVAPSDWGAPRTGGVTFPTS